MRLFNETTEALERQTAMSEILRVISGSPTDAHPVFDTIVASAARLCGAESAAVYRFDDEMAEFVAGYHFSPEALEAYRRRFPCPLRETDHLQRVLDRSVLNISDIEKDAHTTSSGDVYRARDMHSTLLVPMVREDRVIGAIGVSRRDVGAFSADQVELLKTFADQAVIAIENVRLFTELTHKNRALTQAHAQVSEALQRQTATSDILSVISQSPTDVQPVFETIATAAMKLCGGNRAHVFTSDGKQLHVGSLVSTNPGPEEEIRKYFPRPLGKDLAASRAILTGSVVVIPDVLDDAEYALKELAPAGGFRSVLAVPLLREGNSIGAIAVSRPEAGPFPDNQIALLQTFAAQAVIAIENVRLFNETKEALERQIATSEILRVISQSPRDVQPVFDSIAASAMRLCHGSSVTVTTYDGQLLHLVALATATPEGADALRKVYPLPPGRNTAGTRAVLTCSIAAIPDVLEDHDFDSATRAAALAGGFRSVVGVPLIREGKPIGVIVVGRPEAGPFPDKQIALLKTFADQAVIAIENVRLFTELEARTHELTRSVQELKALGEVGQAVSSTLDLETVLSTIVSRAAQLAGMDGGSIWEYDEARKEFYLHATDRLPDELVEALRAAPIRKGEGALGRLAMTGEPVQIRDIVKEPEYPSRLREMLIRAGHRSVLAVPLLREDHLLGALAVNRSSSGDFAPEVIELLKTFATQSALAIQNARLFREVEVKSRELETASRHKSEFLANMSHELRTPLNAIIGFSEVLSERMFGELNEKQAEYIGDILQSGQHLLSLINDILDLSKVEAGRMELELSEFDLPSMIENALTLVRERAVRKGITLGRMVNARLGMIRADERKVKQVLLNLLSNALKFTPEGGRIDVQGAVNDRVAEISVTDTGVGIAPEEQEAVFEEFRQVGTASKKVEGTGLGLAISRKFIELHGGKIWVTSQPGIGSTFAFTLPLR